MARMVVLLFLIISVQNAAGQITPVYPTDTLKIQSAFLQDEREVWIQKPNGYDTTTKNYPVLLVLDADGHFNYVKQLMPYLHNQFNKEIPALFTVGIRSANRSAILTPKTGILQYDSIRGRGKGDEFLSFIQHELFPLLHQQFRLKDFRIVLGHSLGGLLSLYSLYQKPGLFNAVIAASPTVSYAGSHFINHWLAGITGKGLAGPGFLFFTVSDNDMPGYLDANNKLATALQTTQKDSITWQFKIMKGYNHWTIAPATFYEGLLQMFALPAYKKMTTD